jgi:hypothetical protein
MSKNLYVNEKISRLSQTKIRRKKTAYTRNVPIGELSLEKAIDFFYFNKEAQSAQETNALQFKQFLML